MKSLQYPRWKTLKYKQHSYLFKFQAFPTPPGSLKTLFFRSTVIEQKSLDQRNKNAKNKIAEQH